MDDSVQKTKRPYRPRKPDMRDRSEELMTKYYKDPDNQKKLRERVARYKEGLIDLQNKIVQLEKYIFDIPGWKCVIIYTYFFPTPKETSLPNLPNLTPYFPKLSPWNSEL